MAQIVHRTYPCQLLETGTERRNTHTDMSGNFRHRQFFVVNAAVDIQPYAFEDVVLCLLQFRCDVVDKVNTHLDVSMRVRSFTRKW